MPLEPPGADVSARSGTRPLTPRSGTRPLTAESGTRPLTARSGTRPLRARPLPAESGGHGLRLAAGAGAAVVALASTGDVLFLGVLLGAAAGSVWAGTAGVLAGVAVVLRWGSPSLDALAGAQAVLGPAGLVGPLAAAASAWAAALALVLAAPVEGWAALRRGDVVPAVAAVAFAVTAAAVVAGPGPGGDVWIRVVATVVAVGVTLASAPLRRRAGVPVAVAAAVLAALAAVLAALA